MEFLSPVYGKKIKDRATLCDHATLWDHAISKPCYNEVCYEGTAMYTACNVDYAVISRVFCIFVLWNLSGLISCDVIRIFLPKIRN